MPRTKPEPEAYVLTYPELVRCSCRLLAMSAAYAEDGAIITAYREAVRASQMLLQAAVVHYKTSEEKMERRLKGKRRSATKAKAKVMQRPGNWHLRIAEATAGKKVSRGN